MNQHIGQYFLRHVFHNDSEIFETFMTDGHMKRTLDGWMDGWMDGRTNGRIKLNPLTSKICPDAPTDGRKDGWMGGFLVKADEWMDGWIMDGLNRFKPPVF